MRRNCYPWEFQKSSGHPKVCVQEITELTNLASGLMEFEKHHCSTHGERTPVFRLLFMINYAIRENINKIEQDFVDNNLTYIPQRNKDSEIPF